MWHIILYTNGQCRVVNVEYRDIIHLLSSAFVLSWGWTCRGRRLGKKGRAQGCPLGPGGSAAQKPLRRGLPCLIGQIHLCSFDAHTPVVKFDTSALSVVLKWLFCLWAPGSNVTRHWWVRDNGFPVCSALGPVRESLSKNWTLLFGIIWTISTITLEHWLMRPGVYA